MNSDLTLVYQIARAYTQPVARKTRDGRGGTRPGAGRPRLIENPERITVDFEQEDLEAIRDLAERRDTSVAEMIRRAVRQYLGRTVRKQRRD